MKMNQGKTYIEDIITLSIKTENKEKEKEAIMKEWTIGVNEKIITGKTYMELYECVNDINKSRGTKRVIIYTYDLSMKFQFLRNILEFEDVFARAKREVIKCKIKGTEIYLRCAHALSNKTLEEISNMYNRKYKIEDNCECLVIYEYIKRMKDKFGGYYNMPLTFTGIIRKEFKEYISKEYHNKNKFSLQDWYRDISDLLPTYKQFIDLVKSYSGGYVGTNVCRTNKTIYNVKSIDFASSYPYVMVTEKYPMTRFWECNDTLETLDENKAYILDCHFTDIKNTSYFNYISMDKVNLVKSKEYIIQSGKINCAKELYIKCTEQDYEIIKNNYKFEKVELLKCKSAKKEYLPKEMIKFILDKYKTKQMLKYKKDENPIEYREIKENINSIYGMTVTNYIRDEIIYDGEWKEEKLGEDGIKEKLKSTKGKQLFPYAWGVWITAYARRNIWEGIKELGYDAIYSDTDSLKYTGDYDEFINKYNEECNKKLGKMLEYYNIKKEKWMNGIGFFENDGEYEEFKTIGPKKYCYKEHGEIKMRLSGVTRDAAKYLKNDIDNFCNGFKFTDTQTGKLGKYYNDNGKYEKYSVCGFPVSYIINNDGEYIDYIQKSYNKCEVLV